jgi:hypothetical protein
MPTAPEHRIHLWICGHRWLCSSLPHHSASSKTWRTSRHDLDCVLYRRPSIHCTHGDSSNVECFAIKRRRWIQPRWWHHLGPIRIAGRRRGPSDHFKRLFQNLLGPNGRTDLCLRQQRLLLGRSDRRTRQNCFHKQRLLH